ncbi:hypothetical protein B296_00056951 [Ensete ventricosum]|uniref:Uncharacterized protein n=1 Tax=Ensete ventricosum TaxID=4639 RepID=A0A426X0I8_ENSVE|nr:hypothetical protein B296_00056951 [Ensete ventricosum]
MAVGQIEVTRRHVLAAFNEIHDFSYFPKITKLVFRKLWNKLVALRRRFASRSSPVGGRKLTDKEFVSLCSEFMIACTGTTATVLQWIMAHLMLEQHLQRKLFDEIEEIAGA